jgi:two-component system, OmpR family, sensor histidine kinase KdpD
VSTLRERRGLRDLSERPAKSDVSERRAQDYESWWQNSIAANAVPVVATLALVWLATVALVVVNYFIPFNFVTLMYMLPVVVAATQWGIVSGIVAAVAGAAAADFFFYPPLYTFWIRDPQDVIDLTLFLLIALVTSNLAARLKNEAVTLRRREREISELHAFSQGLATCLTGPDLIFAVQDYLSNALRYRAVLIATAQDSHAPNDDAAVPEDILRAAANLMADDASAADTSPVSTVVDSRSRKTWLVRIIAPEILGYGAIAVELGDTPIEPAEVVARRVRTLLEGAMVTFKHLKVKEAIEQATINYRTEILRDALIGGVSHELRTPLASILGSCSVLSQMPLVVNDRKSSALVEAISDQAGQLDNEIRDLLDATRISAKGIVPRMIWTDPTDIVAAALKQKERRLAAHRITRELARDVPLVHVDSVLVEQAFGQLLENAAKYSPVGSEIRISSRCEPDCVVLSVKDQGSGLTPDERCQLGKRCFRGQRHPVAASGSGLGVWIASTFVNANGGSLHAESPGPNLGTTLSLRLPTASTDTAELAGVFDD